jgi:hypothetical protein
MTTGVQFTGNLGANASGSWFTHSWPTTWHVIWYMMPTTPKPGAAELCWDVQVERSSATHCTYFLTVRNLTNAPISFEARYSILN